jgi:hypothetical protein
MKRRQFLPAMVGGMAGITALNWLQSCPANATILNDWIDGAVGSPSAPVAPAAAVSAGVDSMFSEIYGAHYISREQYSRLESGSATHWYDVASKPYARIRSTDGLEHYYFPFNFGDGGVVVISDTSGVIASWDISADRLVPEFSPADMSEWNYYPPKPKAVPVATDPIAASGFPPVPPAAPVSSCY